jgi:hypothetical protein
MVEWIFVGNEPIGQNYTPFASTFQQGPWWHDFGVYGKEVCIQSFACLWFHGSSYQGLENPIARFTIDKPKTNHFGIWSIWPFSHTKQVDLNMSNLTSGYLTNQIGNNLSSKKKKKKKTQFLNIKI